MKSTNTRAIVINRKLLDVFLDDLLTNEEGNTWEEAFFKHGLFVQIIVVVYVNEKSFDILT